MTYGPPMVEILTPDEATPPSVCAPFSRIIYRDDRTFETVVRFHDGGEWAISDREFHNMQPFREIDLAALFAREPGRFRFVGRRAMRR